MKPFLKNITMLCVAVLFTIAANAQSGTTCATAINLGIHDTCANNIGTTGNAKWFKFTAGNCISVTISVTNLPNDQGNVYSIDIYNGSCGILIPFAHKAITNVRDTSSIRIDTNSFVNGTTYFLKLSSNGNASFNLCTKTTIAFCAFDDIMRIEKQRNPNFQNHIDSIELALRRYLATTNALPPFTIPVVVHVLHRPTENEGQGFNISYDQIKWEIQALNAAFQNEYSTYNGESTGPYANNTQIHFCLATTTTPSSIKWANGNTECGVMRYAVSDNVLEHDMSSEQNLLLNTTHPTGAEFPYSAYLNIWLVGDICNGTISGSCTGSPATPPGIVGYAPFAFSPYAVTGASLSTFDGVVIRSDVFGDNTFCGNNQPLFNSGTPFFGLQEGKILAHEVGHYLGLYHTFEDGSYTGNGTCAGTNGFNATTDPTACNQSGDYCCDTPPAISQGVINCSPQPNNCHEQYAPYLTNYGISTPDPNDQIENFMTYSDDGCMNTFTIDQTQRMYGMINLYRPALVDPSNANHSCSCPAFVTNLCYKPQTPCPGKNVCFQTTTGTGAVNWSWNFGDGCTVASGSGTISSGCATGTFQNPCHAYAVAGTYVVTLIATNANGNTYTKTANVVVAYPTAQIVGTSPAPTVCGGSQQCINIVFTGTPPFTAVISDGNTNYSITTNSNICWPVTINSGQPTFNLISFSDAQCTGTMSGNATYNVICCSNELYANGNFNQYTGCLQSPLTSNLACGTWGISGQGIYTVYNTSTGGLGWPSFGLPNTGNAMGIDGPTSLPLVSPPAGTPNQELLCQNVTVPTSGNYVMSFFVSEGSLKYGTAPGYQFQVGVKVNGTMQLPLLTIPTLFFPGNTGPSEWVPQNIQISLTAGANQVCICQTNYFDPSGSGYDYALDNISLRSVSSNLNCCTPASIVVPNGSNSSAVFSSGNVTGQTIDISGLLTVNSNLTFAHCNVRMAQGSEIHVLAPYTLTITSQPSISNTPSHLFSCSAMWIGIVVDPGASVVVNGSSSIEDAETAIVLQNSATTPANFTLNTAILNKNYKDVVVQPFPGTHPGTIQNSQLTCKSSGTSPGGTLNAPRLNQRTSMGVEITDVNNISIVSPGTTNTFDNMDYGIYATYPTAANSVLTVQRNTFSNITGVNIACPFPGPCPPKLGIAIYTTGNLTNTLNVGGTSATKNTFLTCYEGVYAQDYKNISIIGNSFTNASAGTIANPLAFAAVSIVHNSFFPRGGIINVNSNSIINWAIGVNYFLTNQSALVNTTLAINSNNIINSISSLTNYAIVLQSILPSAALNINNNWNVGSNSISNATTGIRITNLIIPPIVAQSNTISLRTGSLRTGILLQNTSAVKVLTNTINGTGAAALNVDGIQLSLSPNNIISNNTINVCTNGIHCIGNNLTDMLTCNKMSACKQGVFLDNTDIGNQQPGGGVPSDNQWFGSTSIDIFGVNAVPRNWDIRNAPNYLPSQNAIIPILFSKSAPNNCPVINPCITIACRQRPLGQVAANQIPFQSFVPQSEFLSKQFTFNQLAGNDSLMHAGTATDAVLQHFYDSVKTASVGQLYKVNELIDSGNVSKAIAVNNSINAQCQIESNHKDFNSIYLKMINSGMNQLTNQQIQDLTSIANQCPLTGGTSVFQARVLLSVITDSIVDYNDNCSGNNFRNSDTPINTASSANDNNSVFKLYPNPSDGNRMTLQYHLIGTENAEMQIADITGRVICSYILPSVNEYISINCNELNNGVYLYRVLENKTIIYTDKIIIVR